MVNAQSFHVKSFGQFQVAIGGISDDYAWSIKQTGDGGYAVAGYTNSFGAGSNDFYFVKLDYNGTIQWSRTFGGTGNDIALSMKLTTDGGYVISGETETYGAGGNDAIFVKIDYNGTLQWKRTIGGLYEDYGECIILTNDGGYAVGGYTASFGVGDFDMYIVKLDSGGALQWMKTIGGPGYDYALSIIQTPDGGYALFGSTSSFGAGYNDFYIAKLDSSGLLQWTKTVGGTGGDYGAFIIQTSGGGYAVAGTTISFGAGNYDMYAVKLDGTGSLQWSRIIGGINFEYVYSIIQTNDGGYALTGSSASFGAGGYDAYIVKLDSSGMIQWNRTFGGPFDDEANSIIQTLDGGFAVSGRTQSFGAGYYDMYIVKLDSSGNTCGNTSSPSPVSGTGGTLGSPTSTATSPTPTVTSPSLLTGTSGTLTTICLLGIQPVSNEIPNSYKLYQNYPNPFNPVTKILFAISVRDAYMRPVQIKVYDILGCEVAILVNEQLSPGTYEVEWNAANYPSGIYFYKLTSPDYSETKKMVLNK